MERVQAVFDRRTLLLERGFLAHRNWTFSTEIASDEQSHGPLKQSGEEVIMRDL